MLGDGGFQAKLGSLRRAVLEGPGELDAAQRQLAFQGTSTEPVMAAYLAKVAERAYTVTDDDVARLRRAGYTEDQIFEATVAAAVGAGLARLERGMAALEGHAP